MNEETRASRGATAGPSKSAFREVSTPSDTPAPSHQQAFIATRFRQPSATAALLAELAFPSVDNWRARP